MQDTHTTEISIFDVWLTMSNEKSSNRVLAQTKLKVYCINLLCIIYLLWCLYQKLVELNHSLSSRSKQHNYKPDNGISVRESVISVTYFKVSITALAVLFLGNLNTNGSLFCKPVIILNHWNHKLVSHIYRVTQRYFLQIQQYFQFPFMVSRLRFEWKFIFRRRKLCGLFENFRINQKTLKSRLVRKHLRLYWTLVSQLPPKTWHCEIARGEFNNLWE